MCASDKNGRTTSISATIVFIIRPIFRRFSDAKCNGFSANLSLCFRVESPTFVVRFAVVTFLPSSTFFVSLGRLRARRYAPWTSYATARARSFPRFPARKFINYVPRFRPNRDNNNNRVSVPYVYHATSVETTPAPYIIAFKVTRALDYCHIT